MDEGQDQSWVPMREQQRVDLFDSAIKYLKNYYNFTTIDDVVDMINGDIPVRNYSALLTFDDGYNNNLKYALPILVKKNIVPILYVATNHVSNHIPFWFDRLDYDLQHAEKNMYEVEINNQKLFIETGDRGKMKISYAEMRKKLKAVGDDREMISIVNSLATRLEETIDSPVNESLCNDDWVGLASWAELENASSARQLVIGSHTVNHTRLACVDLNQLNLELNDSKSTVEKNIGAFCKHFCYPNGSFNGAVKQAVKSAGYLSAVTTVEGLNVKGDDIYALKRIHIPQNTNNIHVLLVSSGLLRALTDRSSRLLPIIKSWI